MKAEGGALVLKISDGLVRGGSLVFSVKLQIRKTLVQDLDYSYSLWHIRYQTYK